MLGSQTSAVYLLDHATATLRLRAVHGPDVAQIARRIRLGMPASGLAALKCRPTACTDLRAAVRAARTLGTSTVLEDRSTYLNVAALGAAQSAFDSRELWRRRTRPSWPCPCWRTVSSVGR